MMAETSNSLPAVSIRHEFFQSPTHIVLTVYAKKVAAVTLELEKRSLSLSLQLPEGREAQLTFDPLFLEIDTSAAAREGNFTIYGTKVEIRLVKLNAGVKWDALEGEGDLDAASLTAMASPEEGKKVQVAHAYPSSSKKRTDFNALNATLAAEKPEGDQALNAMFQSIFSSGTEETKKAMMKSFTESGGTCLSTNWDEVKKKRVEITPPEGMVAKKYEK